MNRLCLAVCALTGVAFVVPSTAQEDPVGSTRTYAIAVRDGLAYVGQTGGLIVRDVSDPVHPIDRSWLSLPTAVLDVSLGKSHVLLAAGTRGLVIADLADPTAPTEVARLDTDGKVKRVLRSGNYAYVADGMNGLLVVDLTDLREPRIVARVSTGGDLRAVALDGKSLAVAEAHGGARVFSLERKNNPREIRRLEADFAARDVCWIGERLYVAAGRRGVAVYEPRASSRPVDFLPAVRSAQHVACSDGLLAVSNLGSALQLFDVSGEGTPAERSRLRLHRSAPIGRARFDGERLWVAVDSAGMGLLDLRDPGAPEQLLPRRREFKVRF